MDKKSEEFKTKMDQRKEELKQIYLDKRIQKERIKEKTLENLKN